MTIDSVPLLDVNRFKHYCKCGESASHVVMHGRILSMNNTEYMCASCYGAFLDNRSWVEYSKKVKISSEPTMPKNELFKEHKEKQNAR